MFVYTAKCSRRKLGLLLVIGIVAVLLLILICVSSSGAASGKTEEDRIAYLEGYGWQVETPVLEEQEILIPESFDGVYEEYAELQSKQGFHLERYCGMSATRYTYTVTNYPEAEGSVVADLLVYQGKIIAGDIQCVALDGFMLPLDGEQAASEAVS